jgi:hypothetical protein
MVIKAIVEWVLFGPSHSLYLNGKAVSRSDRKSDKLTKKLTLLVDRHRKKFLTLPAKRLGGSKIEP